MDCKHARLLLEVAHPLATELEAPERKALAAHLAECPDCGCQAEAERRVDEKLSAAMRDVPVPPGLAQRITRRLQTEREAWYRGWMVRGAGMAAALLFACWIGYAAWFGKKAEVDLEAFQHFVDDVPYTQQLVEQKFGDQGVRMSAPKDFDYRYLRSYGMARFQSGKQVPYLLFLYEDPQKKKPTAIAEVYVLSDQQFDLDNINTKVMAGSQRNVAVLRGQRVAYVIVYPVGADLKLFTKSLRFDA